jgi:hypothetical protein
MKQPDLAAEVAAELRPDPATRIEAARREREAIAYEELKRIIAGEITLGDHYIAITNTLDMVAEIAQECSRRAGDRWNRIALLVRKCATDCEHGTGD